VTLRIEEEAINYSAESIISNYANDYRSQGKGASTFVLPRDGEIFPSLHAREIESWKLVTVGVSSQKQKIQKRLVIKLKNEVGTTLPESILKPGRNTN
jgi:hypothetical protein